MIKESFKKLSYFIFPRRCNLCGEVVYPSASRCDNCLSLYRITGELCDICGCEKNKCSCSKNQKKPEYKRIVAPFYYDGSIVKAIHNFKLYGYTELSNAMAREMATVIKEQYKDIDFDVVVYVPMSNKRLRKRGYNQSQLLAEDLSKILNVPLSNLIKKVYETESQRNISAKQRMVNLHGSFDINASYAEIENKTILLIDDVKTTGSTLSECAYILNAYGAKAVYCATVAVVTKGNKND